MPTIFQRSDRAQSAAHWHARYIVGTSRALLLALALPTMSMADAPPEPPVTQFCSASLGFCARVDDGAQQTVVAPAKPRAGFKAWAIPKRLPNAIVSDHGKVVVAIPATANLLPVDVKPDEVVLSFYVKGQAPHYVALKQVLARPLNLAKTTSHVQWASTYGFERNGIFVLETSEGVRFRIDPNTGRPINRNFF